MIGADEAEKAIAYIDNYPSDGGIEGLWKAGDVLRTYVAELESKNSRLQEEWSKAEDCFILQKIKNSEMAEKQVGLRKAAVEAINRWDAYNHKFFKIGVTRRLLGDSIKMLEDALHMGDTK